MQRELSTSAVALLTAVLVSLAVCMPAFAQGGGTGDSGDRDCSDFASQEEAQDFFDSVGGLDEDLHGLDADGDMEACEDHFGTSGDSGGSDDSGDRDCSDFASQQEAQDFFESEGGPEEDPHRLDADNDGQACEDSDFGGGDDDGTVPEGPVDSGFGPTARPRAGSGEPPTLALGGLALVACGLGLGAVVLRHRSS